MRMLENKKILVTAGPTWVSVDDVRVITNVFGGTTGYRIAVLAAQLGAKVTLLLGSYNIKETSIMVDEPFGNILTKAKNIFSAKAKILLAGGKIEIVKYRYFDELMNLMEERISTGEYNAVIHSAAVADYAPLKADGKIGSGFDKFEIKTVQTPKIISHIKKWDANIFLVQFKLEVGLTEEELIARARAGLVKYAGDLVVANNKFGTSETTAAAYFVDAEKNIMVVAEREEMYERLLVEIGRRI